MNLLDTTMCKKEMIATTCDMVAECQVGCCYDSRSGTCSLNSPKEKCERKNGNWTSDRKCGISECSLGCCVFGEEASITTSRECNKIAGEVNFEKNFKPLDADGTCKSYTGLSKKGACVIGNVNPADPSEGRDCKITTKEICKNGIFNEGFLCTAKSLGTKCKPSKDTICVDGKDGVYYLDSCNNIANIYDATKFNDEAYWKNIIEPKDSCSSIGKNCGNCDYSKGTKCDAYKSGRDDKPSYGNNVCKNLNCANGKKHGESWCVSDYKNNIPGIAPVGSRFFVGKCVEGEISIEQCADFNQEICVQGKNADNLDEANCKVNEWRSCVAANDKGSYAEIEEECKKYPDCIMFLDIAGNEKYAGLPGFERGVKNEDQGRSGDVGKDTNSVIAWCVPKYTEGTVFWQQNFKSSSSSSAKGSGSANNYAGLDYGGSLEETKLICALGSFTCVTRYKSTTWTGYDFEVQENADCRADEDLEKANLWYEGLNERCKMLGPCGIKVNVASELGGNNASHNIQQKEIDSDGDVSDSGTGDYKLSEEYKSKLINEAGIIEIGSISGLSSLTGNAIWSITGKWIATSLYPAVYSTGVSQAFIPSATTTAVGGGIFAGLGGALTGAIAAAAAAYYIVQLMGKAFGWTGAFTNAFSYAIAAGAGVLTFLALLTIGAKSTSWCALLGGWAWLICATVAIIIVAIVFVILYKDQKYYVTTYSCEPWSPPEKGNCNLCNEDIRTCSEYRCRSLGLNCAYYNQNGEPGYCAEFSATWSAKIEPWQEALSEGNKYTDITSKSFKIEGKTNQKVTAWENLEFGITTDDPASCKLDIKHTSSYDEMAYGFEVDSSLCTGNSQACANQGKNHKIVLSPHVNKDATDALTAPLVEGENNYYIRCRNFAGKYNEGEFAVKIIRDKGEDLTSPLITKFAPESGSYLKVGAKETTIAFLVNEPSDCKFSKDFSDRYEDMKYNANCIKNPSLGVMGMWTCTARLVNLSAGENKFYFGCKDQPNIEERMSNKRNINRNNKEYKINVCSTGLNITNVQPKETIIIGKSPVSLSLSADTSGCVQNGKSICYYKFAGGSDIAFLNTNSNKHTQKFTSMPAGFHNITITCKDDAGNSDKKNIAINISIDDDFPVITRAYNAGNKLYISTSEFSECRFAKNNSIGCDFKFEDGSLMASEGKKHSAEWKDDTNYYIKCKDVFGNINPLCGIMLRTY
jgi:hypothetical protein